MKLKNRQSVEVEGYTNTAREEDKFFATLYIGAAPSTAAADLPDLGSDKSLPQAYLVEQPAAATVPPHLPGSDQFQVFVAGKVAFGTEAPFYQGLSEETVVFGPGSISQAHQPDEYMDLTYFAKTQSILAQLIQRFCS